MFIAFWLLNVIIYGGVDALVFREFLRKKFIAVALNGQIGVSNDDF